MPKYPPGTITDVIRVAASRPGNLVLRGYRTSDGTLLDYEVRLIQYSGYIGLVRESLKEGRAGNIRRPQGYGITDVMEAIEEQHASWQTTLDKASAADPTIPEDSGVTMLGGDAVNLHHMEIISQAVIEVSDNVKASRNSKIKTIIKEQYRDASPMNRYLGMLKLHPSKVRSVSFIEAPSPR